MLAQNILAVVAFAAAAIASPVLEERTGHKTPAQKASQKCGNDQTLSCCDNVEKQMLAGIIPVQVGIACTAINGEYLPLRPSPVTPNMTELTM